MREAIFQAAVLVGLLGLGTEPSMADSPLQNLLLNNQNKPAIAGSAARAASVRLAPGQSRAGAEVGDVAHMAGAGKLVPAELEHNTHKINISIPGDFFLNEYALPTGKVFAFKGMLHEDKTRAVINVTIVPDVAAAPGALVDGERGMLEVIVAAPRQELKNYKEEKLPLFMSGSHSFKGVSFSGMQANGKQAKGFVYLTQARDTFFIIFAQDEMPFADQSMPLLLKQARACQLP